MEKDGIWQDEYVMHTFLCDANRKARLTSLCHCLQETAGHHATAYRLGYEGMKTNNQAWVLHRFRVQIDHYPEWEETLKVNTWVQMMRGPFSQRYFLLKNEKNETIGSANTFWVVIDGTTHKPQRLKDQQAVIPLLNEIPTCGTSEKIALPDDMKALDKHIVKSSDLDLLHHVNNVKYLEWILDMPSNVGQYPRQIDLNFVGEAHLNDHIDILTSTSEGAQFYQLKNHENDKEICKAKIILS